jgi:hypothetical protein
MSIQKLLDKRDDISRNARPVIRYLQERIEREFGVSLLMGFEKEFFSETGKNSHVMKRDIRDTKNIRDQRLAEIGAALGRPDIRHPVGRFYTESSVAQYELSTNPAPPEQAVARMDAQTIQLESFMPTSDGKGGRTYPLEKSSLPEKRRQEEREFQEREDFYNLTKMSELNFSPKQNRIDGNGVSGLHVNISLWKDKNGAKENLCYGKDRKLLVDMRHALDELLKTDMAVLMPSEKAVKRVAYLFAENNLKLLRYKDCKLCGSTAAIR